MDVYQKVNALLTIIEDPDDAEKFIYKNWNQLPNDRSSMRTEALEALKEFKTFYKKDSLNELNTEYTGKGGLK